MEISESPKFKRQPDAVSCGPTTIANALIFFNKVPPGIRTIKRVCGTTKEEGTLTEAFHKVLKMAFKGLCRVERPRLRKYRLAMRALFDKCGLCILYWDQLTGEGHYSFCYMKGWEFFVVNDGYHLIAPIEYGDLRALLKNRQTEVWIVRPKNSDRQCK